MQTFNQETSQFQNQQNQPASQLILQAIQNYPPDHTIVWCHKWMSGGGKRAAFALLGRIWWRGAEIDRTVGVAGKMWVQQRTSQDYTTSWRGLYFCLSLSLYWWVGDLWEHWEVGGRGQYWQLHQQWTSNKDRAKKENENKEGAKVSMEKIEVSNWWRGKRIDQMAAALQLVPRLWKETQISLRFGVEEGGSVESAGNCLLSPLWETKYKERWARERVRSL